MKHLIIGEIIFHNRDGIYNEHYKRCNKGIGFAIVLLALIAVLIIFGKKDILWNRFILDWVKTLKFYSI